MYRGSGLGASAFAVPSNVEGALDILQGMVFTWRDRVTRLSPPDPALKQKVEFGASFWAKASELANFDGNFNAAISEASRGIAYMQGVAPMVMRAEARRGGGGAFKPEITKEMDRLKRDSSFVEQVRQTFDGSVITETVADSLTTLSPELASAVRSSRWLVPLAAAGGVMYLISRR